MRRAAGHGITVGALVAAVFIAVCRSVSSADEPQVAATASSVELDACEIAYPASAAKHEKPGTLYLTFTNESPRPVASARFTVTLDGVPVEIEQKGTFSTGIAIHKKLAVFPRVQPWSGPHMVYPACRVTAVTFTDGTAETPSGSVVAAPPPIRIGSCRTHYLGSLTNKMNGGVFLTLTNSGVRDIAVIRMAFAYPVSHGVVRFAGRFSPGVDVDLKGAPVGDLMLQAPISREIEPTCAVTYIKYTDGSVQRYADPFAAGPFAEPGAERR